MHDVDFYEESGGGVTLSGGEPLLRFSEVINLMEEIKLVEKKKTNPIAVVLIVLGVLVVIAAAAYALYRFFAPNYLENFEEEFEDEFDDDFFEDDEVLLEE